MFLVCIAGSREFDDYALLERELCLWLPESGARRDEVSIVSGGARGADTLGEVFAKQYQFPLIRKPADWANYGRSAGTRRNADMANLVKQHGGAVWIFWDGYSTGSAHMARYCREIGVPVHVVNYRAEM